MLLHFNDNQRLIEQIKSQYRRMTCGPHLGAKYILVVFQDFLQPISKDLVEAVQEVKAMFHGVTDGTLLRTIWCSYAGTYGGTDAKANQFVKDHISKAADMMAGEKNILVSEYPSANYGDCWEPVIRFLEVLRKDNSLMQAADGISSVGYFRYRSYNAAEREKLVSEVEKLERVLNSDGKSLLKNNVKTALDQLKSEAEQCTHIDPDVQPVHPDLYLSRFTGPLAWFQKQTALKPDGSYQKAVKATKDAVNKTAKQLKEQIKMICREARMDYSDVTEGVAFDTLINHADTTIMGMLSKYPEEAWLDLKYQKEEDFSDRIGTYLRYVIASTIWQEQELYCKELCAQIKENRDAYQNEMKNCIEERNRKKLELLEKPSVAMFLQDSVLNDNRYGINEPFSMATTSVTVCIDYGLNPQEKAVWDQVEGEDAAKHNKSSQIAFAEMHNKHDGEPLCVIELRLFTIDGSS